VSWFPSVTMPDATLARLFLHIRTLAGGRPVATVVPFTDLACDGATVAVARERAVEAAQERLADVSGTLRADLAGDAEAALETRSLTVAPERSAEKLTLTVSVVVIARKRSGGMMHSVWAPGVPGWSVAAHGRAEALRLAARALEDIFGGWPAAPVIALDLTGPVELHPLELPFEPQSDASASRVDPAAELAADDLTAMAAAGRLGRLDRRDPLVERVLAVLAGDGRASVLLVGPGDVGKSALTHEVAARLAAGEVPPALRGRALIRLSANELIAGALHRNVAREGQEDGRHGPAHPGGNCDGGPGRDRRCRPLERERQQLVAVAATVYGER